MQERPDVTLPLARSCPFAPPDGYDRLRETPGLATAALPGGALTWLVTRLSEARAALAAPEFSTDRSDPAFPLPQQRPRPADPGPRPALTPEERRARSRGASLIGMDPPDHTTARRAVIGEFTARRVHALRPRIQQIVDERIEALLAAGPPADLVELLALPVPSQVICELLGVPYDRHEFFQSRSTALLTHRVPATGRFEALGDLFRSWTSWSAARRRNRAATCSAGRSRPGARRATTTTGTWSAWPSCCWWPGTRRPRA